MPEITQADREAARAYLRTKGSIDDSRITKTDHEELAAYFMEHREAAVAAYIATTTPPEPRALTAEIVMSMLPANRERHGRLVNEGLYVSKCATLNWIFHDGEFYLFINNGGWDINAIGTDQNFAALIAAFGIEVGVKHG